jgi:4-oxalocrotonate tautomerase
MPMITSQIAAEPDAGLAREAAKVVTSRAAEILGKDPKVTAVAVEFIPRRHWFIAGRSTEEIGKAGVGKESYVHVDDVRADAYGDGGLTQERRYVPSRPAAA